jgi:hypothetical protein
LASTSVVTFFAAPRAVAALEPEAADPATAAIPTLANVRPSKSGGGASTFAAARNSDAPRPSP